MYDVGAQHYMYDVGELDGDAASRDCVSEEYENCAHGMDGADEHPSVTHA